MQAKPIQTPSAYIRSESSFMTPPPFSKKIDCEDNTIEKPTLLNFEDCIKEGLSEVTHGTAGTVNASYSPS